MVQVMLFLIAALVAVVLVLLMILINRQAKGATDKTEVRFDQLERNQERIERVIQTQMGQNREEAAATSKQGREELANSLKLLGETIATRMMEIATLQKSQLELFADQLKAMTSSNASGMESLRQALEERLKHIQDETSRKLELMRTDSSNNALQVREETKSALTSLSDSLVKSMIEVGNLQKSQMDIFSDQLRSLIQSSGQSMENLRLALEERLKHIQEETGKKLELMRADSANNATQVREDTKTSLRSLSDTLVKRVIEVGNLQKSQMDIFSEQLKTLTGSNEQRLDKMRETLDVQMRSLQEDNSKKLEQMRATVDEKLHDTLEKRLGESFKIVSERLEQVHKGLGEMQTLATGVGDLKKVLTNVKARGNFGEVQLGSLLEQILSSEQYETNVATRKGSAARVEFAIKLPGRDQEKELVWLPIDAKFPQEDYLRLVEAQESGNLAQVEETFKQLERTVKEMAKVIHDKYLDPPNTTDFGIMFLPTEGLFAEVLRRTGLFEMLQRDYKVVVTGPTTLAALLNSLQMGFRTLAVEKRSSEVWTLLGAVKTEFSTFGNILEKTHKKLQEASNTIDSAAVRSRAIERKLRGVQELPAADAVALLGSDGDAGTELFGMPMDA